MSFIKHSDGQITTIIKSIELTEEQKKIAQNLSDSLVKQEDKTDTSKEKQSEN